MAKIMNPTKVVTGKNTRFSYLIVNEPKSINGGTPKYSVSLKRYRNGGEMQSGNQGCL